MHSLPGVFVSEGVGRNWRAKELISRRRPLWGGLRASHLALGLSPVLSLLQFSFLFSWEVMKGTSCRRGQRNRTPGQQRALPFEPPCWCASCTRMTPTALGAAGAPETQSLYRFLGALTLSPSRRSASHTDEGFCLQVPPAGRRPLVPGGPRRWGPRLGGHRAPVQGVGREGGPQRRRLRVCRGEGGSDLFLLLFT